MLADKFPDRYIKELVGLYKSAYLDILKEQKKITVSATLRNKLILQRIDDELKKLDKETLKYLKKQVPEVYKIGSDSVINDSKKQGILITKKSFSRIHTKAVNQIVKESYIDFSNAMRVVSRDSERLVAEAVKLQMRNELAKGIIKGDTIRTSKEAIAKVLSDTGAVALKDKGGKVWQLDTYAEMLSRTKMMHAHNDGVKNRMIENGYDLVEVSSHPDSSALCKPWQGKIYSLTGKTKGYKMLSEAIDGGLFRPNCRHTISIYHKKFN